MRVLILSFLVLITQAATAADKIISKEDADYIFSLDRAGWETYTQQIGFPEGWNSRFKQLDTGTVVLAFDRNTGYGLSIQPLYEENSRTPRMLIVGSYYPQGTFPELTNPDMAEQFRQDLQAASLKELGPNYLVEVVFKEMEASEGIELVILKNPKNGSY